MKRLFKDSILVIAAIFITIIVLEVVHLLSGNSFDGEELIYALFFGEIGYFLPFLAYFLIYRFIQKKLGEQSVFFLRVYGKLLVGIGLTIVTIIFLSIIIFTARDLTWISLKDHLFNFIFFVVFVPTIIIMDSLYDGYIFNHK
jgi:hypothetical protein